MKALVTLSRRAGTVVSRSELFEVCWGSAAVGDDSLNRTIALLRKALTLTGENTVRIDTVAGAGYLLRLVANSESADAAGPVDSSPAIDAARTSWRRGAPEPDHLAIEQLRNAARQSPDDPAVWGMLALLSRYAAEYAEHGASGDHVAECEAAAARALTIDPAQPEALVALATVAPLFGRWLGARTALEQVLARSPDCAAAMHELAIVEMASGRVAEAKRLMDGLIATDPLAACFNYKSIWQHWCVGDLAGMDHVADRAIQLWPTHPAIWMARFWTLVHTERARAAIAMLEDSGARPAIPPPMLDLLLVIARAAASADTRDVDDAVRFSCKAAERGPAQAVAALLGLGLFDAADEAFAVAYGYYARAGEAPVPVRHTASDSSINDQHRRVTQPLFTPAGTRMRADSRFPDLCERIGLADYWRESGFRPDFLTGS